jgi:hypothetical protein
MESAVQVSDKDIAQEAVSILSSPTQQGKSLLLSMLGSKLSMKFTPWRDVLSGRLLGKLLDSELHGRVIFDGAGPQQSIRLIGDTELPDNIRFDKTVWAAFSKPIPSECRRILRTQRPFKFADEAGDLPLTLDTGSYEVEPHLIPDPGLARPSRDRAIVEGIGHWCSLHELDINSLVDISNAEVVTSGRASLGKTATPHPGIDALLRLINAIPTAERKNYSLTLDLIQRLLSSK